MDFVKAIELAASWACRILARNRAQPGDAVSKQVDEIVRVYNEKFFPVCEKAKVRILWEPWPDGENCDESRGLFSAV